ncbi:MAG: septal ring lytic transglycosylase RlpA family protein [Hyphomicrobiaceae bacterium]
MRQYLLAVISIVTFGLLGAGNASAAWQDSIFGTNANSRSEARPARAERAARSESGSTEARPQRRTRAARAESNDTDQPTRSQRTARSRSSGSEGGSSIGSGLASYYWQPQRVASGGWFNPNAMTAAHKTLPFGTRVRVTNERNGQSVEVTINDRGPYVAGRVIDLSSAAAGAINMKGSGVVPVRMTVLGR